MAVRISGNVNDNRLTAGTGFGNISGTAFSAFAWARYELYQSTTNAPGYMVGRWDGGAGTSQYILAQDWSTKGVALYTRSAGTTISTAAPTKIPLFRWVPCGATKDASNARVYLAGALDKTGADANVIQNVSASYVIGNASITTPARASFAHVCVWNAVLTHEEMMMLHRGQCLPPQIRAQNIVAYHPLDSFQPSPQGGGVLTVGTGRVDFEPFDLRQAAAGYGGRLV